MFHKRKNFCKSTDILQITIGIKEKIDKNVNNIDWRKLLKIKPPTYVILVINSNYKDDVNNQTLKIFVAKSKILKSDKNQ